MKLKKKQLEIKETLLKIETLIEVFWNYFKHGNEYVTAPFYCPRFKLKS